MADKRVVIVTGGGTGIGEATARSLSQEGHRVVASGRRPEPLRRLERETGALAYPSDVGDPAAAEGLVRNQRLAAVGYVWAFASLTASTGARAHYDRRRTHGERRISALRNLFNRTSIA